MSVLKQYNAAAGIWQTIGGMGLPQTPVSFSAHKNGVAQNGIAANTETKVTFPSTEYNYGNGFDASVSTFTPKIAGVYAISASVRLLTSATNIRTIILLCKNGGAIKVNFSTLPNIWSPAATLTTQVYMNGSTDYLEVYIKHENSDSRNLDGASVTTYFQACLIPDSYDSTKQIVDLSAAMSEYLLGAGETAKISYTNATSIPLHIATEEGLYEVIIRNDSSMTVSANNGTYLKPNATDYSNAYTRVGYYSLSTGSGGVARATESNVYSGATGVTIKARMLISTITKSKSIEYNSIGKRIADLLNETGNIFWNDTTTVWSSLGTITFPFAQSGTIIIKRVE